MFKDWIVDGEGMSSRIRFKFYPGTAPKIWPSLMFEFQKFISMCETSNQPKELRANFIHPSGQQATFRQISVARF